MSKKREGGWSGIGMATVGIDPTNFGILNDHPTKIPPGELLGGVVKNCPNSYPCQLLGLQLKHITCFQGQIDYCFALNNAILLSSRVTITSR